MVKIAMSKKGSSGFNPLTFFLLSFGILLSLAILAPIFEQAFNSSTQSPNNGITPNLPKPDNSSLINAISTLGNILLNVVLCLVWNFNLPSIWNYPLYIVRIIAAISLWYIANPAK